MSDKITHNKINYNYLNFLNKTNSQTCKKKSTVSSIKKQREYLLRSRFLLAYICHIMFDLRHYKHLVRWVTKWSNASSSSTTLSVPCSPAGCCSAAASTWNVGASLVVVSTEGYKITLLLLITTET